MLFTYAVYITMCIVGDSSCFLDHYKIDTYSLRETYYNTDSLGTTPNWHTFADGDLAYEYAYGECSVGRSVRQEDLDMIADKLGGDPLHQVQGCES